MSPAKPCIATVENKLNQYDEQAVFDEVLTVFLFPQPRHGIHRMTFSYAKIVDRTDRELKLTFEWVLSFRIDS